MRKRKILIIDDDKISHVILNKMLDGDFDILHAYHGSEGLDYLKTFKDSISVILLDLNMPVMNGFEFLNYYKKNNDFNNIPVIVLTQESDQKVEATILSSGAVDYVKKPYDKNILNHRINNIIKLSESDQKINNLERDPETDAYTSVVFFEKARELIFTNPDKKFSILSFVLPKYSLYTELFGSLNAKKNVGELIKNISEKVQGKNGVLGRIEKEYFAVIIETKFVEIDYINHAIEEFEENFSTELKIKINLGIYDIEKPEENLEICYDKAKIAATKITSINNRVVKFDDTLRSMIMEQEFITSQVEKAIKNNEFHVYYQPQFSLKDGHMYGAEALVRWFHPTRGLISPGAFIPILEKNGYIFRVDLYIWESVCKSIRKWLDMGIKVVPISVNLSRIDIYNPHIVTHLKNLIEKYQLSYDLLHLEITETAYTENSAQLIQVIKTLKDIGFSIEMDDFGSGYSSLNMLSDIPFDVLKIDAMFLGKNINTFEKQSIISFIIKLAKSLNLEVIAEGIEYDDDLEFLVNESCDVGQGYLLSYPLPIEKFEDRLINNPFYDLGKIRKKDSFKDIPYDFFNNLPCGLAYINAKSKNFIQTNKLFMDFLEINDMAELLSDNFEDLLFTINQKAFRIEQLVDREPVLCKTKKTNKDFYLKATRSILRGEETYQILLFDIPVNVLESVSFKEFYDIIDFVPAGIFKYSASGPDKIEFANNNLFKMLGYTREEFIEKFDNKFENIIHPDDRAKVIADINKQIEKSPLDFCEYRVVTKNSEEKWVYDIGHKIKDEFGNEWFYVIVIGDNDLKKSQEEARINKERYNHIIEAMQDCVFEYDVLKNIFKVSDSFEKKFGTAQKEKFVNEKFSFKDLIHESDVEIFDRFVEKIKEASSFASEIFRIKKEDGTYLWCKVSVSVIKSKLEKDELYVGVIQDINDSVTEKHKLEILATTDRVTNLYNRTKFDEICEKCILPGKKMGFIFLDIDNFKTINDDFGHLKGDLVLREFASKMTHLFKDVGQMSRLGGDEFAILLDRPYDEEKINEQLQKLSQGFVVDNLNITSSIGILHLENNSFTYHEVLQIADEAMYKVKKHGKKGLFIVKK